MLQKATCYYKNSMSMQASQKLRVPDSRIKNTSKKTRIFVNGFSRRIFISTPDDAAHGSERRYPIVTLYDVASNRALETRKQLEELIVIEADLPPGARLIHGYESAGCEHHEEGVDNVHCVARRAENLAPPAFEAEPALEQVQLCHQHEGSDSCTADEED